MTGIGQFSCLSQVYDLLSVFAFTFDYTYEDVVKCFHNVVHTEEECLWLIEYIHSLIVDEGERRQESPKGRESPRGRESRTGKDNDGDMGVIQFTDVEPQIPLEPTPVSEPVPEPMTKSTMTDVLKAFLPKGSPGRASESSALLDPKISLRKIMFRPKLPETIGLANCGNTCFYNSGVQILYLMEDLWKDFAEISDNVVLRHIFVIILAMRFHSLREKKTSVTGSLESSRLKCNTLLLPGYTFTRLQKEVYRQCNFIHGEQDDSAAFVVRVLKQFEAPSISDMASQESMCWDREGVLYTSKPLSRLIDICRRDISTDGRFVIQYLTSHVWNSVDDTRLVEDAIMPSTMRYPDDHPLAGQLQANIEYHIPLTHRYLYITVATTTFDRKTQRAISTFTRTIPSQLVLQKNRVYTLAGITVRLKVGSVNHYIALVKSEWKDSYLFVNENENENENSRSRWVLCNDSVLTEVASPSDQDFRVYRQKHLNSTLAIPTSLLYIAESV